MTGENTDQPGKKLERTLPDLSLCRIKPSEISGLVYCLVPGRSPTHGQGQRLGRGLFQFLPCQSGRITNSWGLF